MHPPYGCRHAQYPQMRDRLSDRNAASAIAGFISDRFRAPPLSHPRAASGEEGSSVSGSPDALEGGVGINPPQREGP